MSAQNTTTHKIPYYLKFWAFIRKPASVAAAVGAVLGFVAGASFDVVKIYLHEDSELRLKELEEVRKLGKSDTANLESQSEAQIAAVIVNWTNASTFYETKSAKDKMSEGIALMSKILASKKEERKAREEKDRKIQEEKEALNAKNAEAAKAAQLAAAQAKARELEAIKRSQDVTRVLRGSFGVHF